MFGYNFRSRAIKDYSSLGQVSKIPEASSVSRKMCQVSKIPEASSVSRQIKPG